MHLYAYQFDVLINKESYSMEHSLSTLFLLLKNDLLL
jgi:hypothetical protein